MTIRKKTPSNVSRDEKRNKLLNKSMDDVSSVTLTSKQVNQKKEQNHEEIKKIHYIHHRKKKLNKIITQMINHLQYQRKINHHLMMRRRK